MKLSDPLTEVGQYPFVALTDAKRKLIESGIEPIDFGVGEPREVTPLFIREALCAHVPERSTYPLAPGLPVLRSAISQWCKNRFDADIDPDSEVIPTMGSKEAIFHLAQIVGGANVIVTTPGYPVPARGAEFAGKSIHRITLDHTNKFLPDLASIPEEILADTAILWLNYPNNPTAATAPLSLYEEAVKLARKYDFILASDEAYSEIFFGDTPPRSALELGDFANLIVFNSLSKRSSMPGFRIGFAAGDSRLIAALKKYRPNVGVAPPVFTQEAGAVAYQDEDHVVETRTRYAGKRNLLLPVFERHGLRHVGGDATFFLWLHAGENAKRVATLLLEAGIVVAPGEFFGLGGEGFLRVALVPTVQECEKAAEKIDEALEHEAITWST